MFGLGSSFVHFFVCSLHDAISPCVNPLTRVDVRQLSRGVGGAREIRKMMLGGAVGAPEARNMLGMLVVMSQ